MRLSPKRILVACGFIAGWRAGIFDGTRRGTAGSDAGSSNALADAALNNVPPGPESTLMELWAGSGSMPKLTGSEVESRNAGSQARVARAAPADGGTLTNAAASTEDLRGTLDDLVTALPASDPRRTLLDAAIESTQLFCTKAYPDMSAAHLNGTNPDSFSMLIPEVRFGHGILSAAIPGEKDPPSFWMHIYNVGLNAPAPRPGDEDITEATDDTPVETVPIRDKKSAAILNSAIQLKRRNPGGQTGYLESLTAAHILLGLERRFLELRRTDSQATREDVVFVDVGGGMGWFGLLALSRGLSSLLVACKRTLTSVLFTAGFSLLEIEPLDSNVRLVQASICANSKASFHTRAVVVAAAAADSTVHGKKCSVRSRDSNFGGAIVCRSSLPSTDGTLGDREESAVQKQLATTAGNRVRGTVPMTTLDDVVLAYLASDAGKSPRTRSGLKSLGVVRISARGEEPFVVSGGSSVLQLGPPVRGQAKLRGPLVVLSYNPRKLGGEMPARAMLSQFSESGYIARTEGFAPFKELPLKATASGNVVEDLVRRHRATLKAVYLERP